jgi:DNA-directed RNA polymerase subunit E'/Rpb7
MQSFISSRGSKKDSVKRSTIPGKMSLYIKNIISKKLTVPVKFVGVNIKSVLEKILADNFEGKCCIEGYVKRDSVKIITYSCGNITGNVAIFTVVFEFLVCNPPHGMRISCAVKNITNAGILARVDEDIYSPVNIFIARDHHYSIPYFSELKVGDIIMVRVIGQRFELNDTFVSVIAELELGVGREQIESTKKPRTNIAKPASILSAISEETGEVLSDMMDQSKSLENIEEGAQSAEGAEVVGEASETLEEENETPEEEENQTPGEESEIQEEEESETPGEES